jgi:hypothetical protein
MIYFPFGEKATEVTYFLYPLIVIANSPVFRSQTFMVLSFDPLAIYLLSGEIAIEPISFLCPLIVFSSFPDALLQFYRLSR